MDEVRNALTYLVDSVAPRSKAPSGAATGDDAFPVIIVPGFLGTSGTVSTLNRRLRDDGIRAYSFHPDNLNVSDTRVTAQALARYVDHVLAECGTERVSLIGHSLGGLIGWHYIKRLGGHAKTKKMITMGTPLKGSWIAPLVGIAAGFGILSPTPWHVLPKSGFFVELHADPLPGEVEFYSISALRDWAVPPEECHLRGVLTMPVPLGHTSLVVDRTVYQRIMWALRR